MKKKSVFMKLINRLFVFFDVMMISASRSCCLVLKKPAAGKTVLLSALYCNIYHLCFWAVIHHIPPCRSQHIKKHLSQSITVFVCGSFMMSMYMYMYSVSQWVQCRHTQSQLNPSIRTPSLSPLDSTFPLTASTHFPSSEWRTSTYNIITQRPLGCA